MTDREQPKALRLADWLDGICCWPSYVPQEAAFELRRLHEENQTLRERLEQPEEVPCKDHPDAPHGFDRNASLSEDRYVCECESWEPRPEPEPVCDKIPQECWSIRCQLGRICKNTAPPKREWVGLTSDEVVKELGQIREQVTGDVFGGFYRAIEAKLRSKNT